MRRPVYVPVLRWKRAEQKALEMVASSDRGMIVPLFEFTPRDYEPKISKPSRTVRQVALENSQSLARCWGGRPAYVDIHLLSPKLRGNPAAHPIRELGIIGAATKLDLIPVTGLAFPSHEIRLIADAISNLGGGGALRLNRKDLLDPALRTRAQRVLERLGLSRDDTDLLIDYEITDPSAPPIESVLERLQPGGRWRTTVAISGAFPKDLTGFSPGEHLHPRLDLTWWRSQAGADYGPTEAFGDYAIQHPIFSEPPRRANFSASIRYTTNEHWVVMRGEGVFNDDGPGFMQWPANAQLLCDRAEFCGPEFSYGDRYISTMGGQQAKTGNAETWLRAGLNHHLVFTARQLSKMFGP